MRFIKSLLFNFIFYGWTCLCCSSIFVLFCLPRKVILKVARAWSVGTLKAADIILGITYKVQGLEHIPSASRGVIVACKHQSTWETIVFSSLFEDPAIVLKSSLLHIPFFGLFLRKLDMIPVARSGRNSLKTLPRMFKKAERAIDQKRAIVIFPEGTRTLPGVQSTYHTGVYTLYHRLQVPVVPAGLNSGVFWERRKFCKKPGTILLIFGSPIQPGLSRLEFMRQLKQRIEDASHQANCEAQHVHPDA
jgi:1-acyl-sn-glycerol-3-phosphate acyltransferase